MLAPTRDLVAELNRPGPRRPPRRRRPDAGPAGREACSADGNLAASAGDMVITRRNDRRLRITATDWVKNGDRWTVTQVHAAAAP